MELTQEELEALVAQAQSGDPRAMAMLNFVLTGVAENAPLNPGQGLADYPALDKSGNFDLNDQMTASGKYRSDTVDRASNVNAGPGAHAPGTFIANPTWEPLKTPIRDNLRRYTANGATTWKGVMSEVLLNGGTDDEALAAGQAAVANGMAPPAEMVQDTYQGQSTMVPVDPYISMSKFAQSNFEKLATEPNIDGPNVRETATGGYEVMTDEGLSDTHQWYVDQGIPLPTSQYDMQWLESTPGGAAMIEQNAADLTNAEASWKAAMSTPQGMNQFGEYTDPEMRARQQQAMAQANYALNRPQSDDPEQGNSNVQGGGAPMVTPGGAIGSVIRGVRDRATDSSGGGGGFNPVKFLNPFSGGNDEVVGGLTAAVMNSGPGKARQAEAARFKAMEDHYSGTNPGGGRKAPRREVKYRETKEQRDQQFNSMVARNQARMDRNTMEGDLRRMQKQGRTPTGDVMEQRQRAMLRELGLNY